MSVERYGEDIVVSVPGEVFLVLVPVTPTRLRSTAGESYAEVHWVGGRVAGVTFVVEDTIELAYAPAE